jgi:hypothetical protein
MFTTGVMLLSCASKNDSTVGLSAQYLVPAVASEAVESKEEILVRAEEEFDPKNPPLVMYTETKREIQAFVRKVDALIKARNYEEWVKLLSKEYLDLINSRTFLTEVSQQPRLKSQNIMLRTSRDYFLNVVVTSRANLQANDIEFVSLTRVMAFIINQSGQRIRIYTLDKIEDGWEIVD